MNKIFIALGSVILLSCNLRNSSGDDNKIQSIDRPAYSLKYAPTWQVDSSSDEDFDIDYFFNMQNHDKTAFSMFFIYGDSIDEQEHVSDQLEAHLGESIKNGKVTRFTHWGNYEGHGARINGEVMGIFKGEIDIFAHASDSSSFLVVSEFLNRHEAEDVPAMKVIEQSFVLK